MMLGAGLKEGVASVGGEIITGLPVVGFVAFVINHPADAIGINEAPVDDMQGGAAIFEQLAQRPFVANILIAALAIADNPSPLRIVPALRQRGLRVYRRLSGLRGRQPLSPGIVDEYRMQIAQAFQ